MHLDDAQLWEVLDEIKLETARREGMAAPLMSPLGQWHGPAGGVDANLDDGEVNLQGGRWWGPSELAQWPTGPLKQRRILVTSSAYSWLD